MPKPGCASASADPRRTLSPASRSACWQRQSWGWRGVAGRATHRAVPDKDKRAATGDPGDIGQVVELVKDYVRQETLGPIKGAGRWLGRGVAGAFLIGTGCVFLVLAALRMIQNEYG